MSRIYVYALVEKHRGAMRIEGHRITFVPAAGFYAAAARLSSPPELTEAALRAQHRLVVAIAREFDAILPVRFGGWIDVPELEQLIATHERRLRRAFALVRRREQMTVRVFGAERIAARAITSSSGTAYLKRRRDTVHARNPAIAADIRRAVKPLVESERIDAGRGSLQLTVHHLVPSGCSRQYKVRMSAISASLAGRNQIVVSGPWPPFAFAPDIWS